MVKEMTQFPSPTLFTLTRWLAVLCCGCVTIPRAQAQPTELVALESITVGGSGPVTFVFVDHGTGASGYTVQSAAAVGEPVQWQTEAGAALQPLGEGRYQVTVPGATPDRFYRVTGANGNPEPIELGFAVTDLEATEGEPLSLTVTFSRSYVGTIRYSIEGSAEPGDYAGLNGEIQVNGTTAIIPVNLTENSAIGELKQLILTLQSGGGALADRDAQGVVTILENDADWRGIFNEEAVSAGLTLRIRKTSGTYSAVLAGDGSGLVPQGEFNTSITLGDDTFAAVSDAVPLDPADTLQQLPANMVITLNAANGMADQIVSDVELRGAATITISYPGRGHLNRTSEGAFALFKSPVAPSTREATLVAAP